MKIVYVERSFIIDLNKKIIYEWNARHPESSEFISASEAGLDEVLKMVEKVGNNLEIKDQTILKAAHILGGLPWQLQQEIIDKLVLYIRKHTKSL